MYTNITFVLYIIALLISFVCLVFIGLIFVRKNDRSNKTYMAARRFAVIVLLTDLLYFVFYYREVVQEQYELEILFRITDYVLCISLFLCWFMIVKNMTDANAHTKVFICAIVLTIIRFVSSLSVTTAFMGVYYNIENANIRIIWSAAEITFVLVTAIITIYYCICVLGECISSLRKAYVTLCSLLLIFWGIAQGVVDVGLFTGKYGKSAWLVETPDFTGAILFLLNLATCVFVFKEDFSPLFLNDMADKNNVDTNTPDTLYTNEKSNELILKEKLDNIAATHKLTVREREVLELMYCGFTNPEIGKALYISINTVKKHTHNIFAKLDAGNRMEVVYIINNQNKKQPLE